MTTQQALDTINGAEIMSLNVPIRKLQSAVVALLSAARRCLKYDKQLVDGELAQVVRCKDCAHMGLFDCPLCYIEKHTLQFIEVSPDFYCAKAERRPL